MPRHPNLTIVAVPHPVEDYYEQLDAALDILADALAEKFIEQARREVAAELGIDPDQLPRRGIGTAAELGGDPPGLTTGGSRRKSRRRR